MERDGESWGGGYEAGNNFMSRQQELARYANGPASTGYDEDVESTSGNFIAARASSGLRNFEDLDQEFKSNAS